ncbi:MAG: IclR family transcriptional regulator [Eubacteriales bacterium]|nr:IclR family transcriptional regulator [Eubacteriales bacterium]
MDYSNKRKLTSLEKGLYLLSLFSEEPYKYSVTQLVERTGLNRTTIYRTLTTLEAADLLIKDGKSKAYKLGPMTYHMGNIYLMNANYKERILSLLEKIAEESQESVGIAHRQGNKVVSIYAVEIHQPVKINDKPGTFYPMNKGCYGKCLMAYHDLSIVEKMLDANTFEKTAPNTLTQKQEILEEYERIRKQGFVESIEETLPYIIGVGLPLKNPDGRVENVVAISFFKQEDDPGKIEKMKAILYKYQRELEKYIL